MIEINKKAKPFNPCEEILGTELMYAFQRCQLTGSHYYLAEPKTKSRDIIALARAGRWTSTYKKLQAAGWKEVNMMADNLGHFYRFQKGDDFVIVTSDIWSYTTWIAASDVCRLMNFDADPNYKNGVQGIFKVVVDGMGTKWAEDNKVQIMHIKEEDFPDMEIKDEPQYPKGLKTATIPAPIWAHQAQAIAAQAQHAPAGGGILNAAPLWPAPEENADWAINGG